MDDPAEGKEPEYLWLNRKAQIGAWRVDVKRTKEKAEAEKRRRTPQQGMGMMYSSPEPEPEVKPEVALFGALIGARILRSRSSSVRQGHFTGVSAEYYVASVLAYQQLHVGMVHQGGSAVDLLVSTPDGARSTTVQVKGNRNARRIRKRDGSPKSAIRRCDLLALRQRLPSGENVLGEALVEVDLRGLQSVEVLAPLMTLRSRYASLRRNSFEDAYLNNAVTSAAQRATLPPRMVLSSSDRAARAKRALRRLRSTSARICAARSLTNAWLKLAVSIVASFRSPVRFLLDRRNPTVREETAHRQNYPFGVPILRFRGQAFLGGVPTREVSGFGVRRGGLQRYLWS